MSTEADRASGAAVAGPTPHIASPAEYSALDEALIRLEAFGPESPKAGASHAPMVVEALCALGRSAAVMPWLDGYERRLIPQTESGAALPASDWREHLGQWGSFPGWGGHFQRELEDRSWESVIRDWVPRLAPGFAAAACHGPIRTAHAVRALSIEDTPPRRRELARGLAYWAARYRTLPQQDAPTRAMMPAEALRTLPVMPLFALRRRLPNLLSTLAVAKHFSSVKKAIRLVDPARDPSRFIGEMTEASAQAFVGNEAGFIAAVAYIHALTAPADMRLLLPYLSPDDGAQLLRHCWHVLVAFHQAFGPPAEVDDPGSPEADVEGMIDSVVDVAVTTTDPHLVKFVEACLRERRENPTPVYLRAALLAVDALRGHPT